MQDFTTTPLRLRCREQPEGNTMKTVKILLVIGLASLSGMAYGAGEHPGHGTHWGYTGEIGPDRWSALKPEFTACSGKNQSPIDLTGTIEAQMKPVQFS
jgi:carbonic anhydrase